MPCQKTRTSDLILQVVFKQLYPTAYTSDVSTRVSNALLVGAIIGQVFVGLICDRIGRKTALVATTFLIVVGATLGTAAHGAHGSVDGLFWFLTFSRGITGVGVGGEYPASSTSASEAANEKMVLNRGPGRSAYFARDAIADTCQCSSWSPTLSSSWAVS